MVLASLKLMTKKELIDRWSSPDGIILLKEVAKALKKNRPLTEVPGLDLVDDRIDLRGAILSTIEKQQTIGTKEHSLTLKTGTLKLKNATIEDIDFSYADISYGLLQESTITNCLFKETVAKEMDIYATDFERCKFEKTNFAYSFMNKNVAGNAGSFKNCRFFKTNLKETIFSFPIIDNCFFEDCKLYGADFDGSRMRNVTFVGEVDSPFIGGYSWTAQKSLFWIFNKIEPKDYPNLMQNVDFTRANIKDIMFQREIDLSGCKFPNDGDFILIKNVSKLFPKLRDFILKNWEGEELEQGLSLVDNLYFGPKKQGMTADVISTLHSEYLGIGFQEKLNQLIREYNDIYI